MSAVVAFLCGALFSIGACIAGIVRPSKILGFLDFGGAWDASLLVVFACALAVHTLAWRAVSRAQAPRFGGSFPAKTTAPIDPALVAGAAIFGLGWGLSGYCPGPAVVALASAAATPVVFFAAVVLGIYLVDWLGPRPERLRP